MTMRWARILVLLCGIALPYLARLPGGLSWLKQYTDVGIVGWLFFGAFNAIAWGAILMSSAAYRHPVSLLAPAVPGFHTWLVRGLPAAVRAVNFPASESELVPGPAPEADGISSVSVGAETPIRTLREGTPLWPSLLAAALILAMAEIAVVWKIRPTVS